MHNPIVWTKVVPLKVSAFVWRACVGRIPTSVALASRGIVTASFSCALCETESDEVNHIFLGCQTGRNSLSWIFNWGQCMAPNFNSVSKFVDFAGTWGQCKKREMY